MKPKIVGKKEAMDLFCGTITTGFAPFYIKIVEGKHKRYFPLNIRNFINVYIKKVY